MAAGLLQLGCNTVADAKIGQGVPAVIQRQVATILAGHDERTLVKSVVKWPEHRAIYP